MGSTTLESCRKRSRMSVKPMAGFDMDQRDPNNLNEHLQVLWDDIIGEPEGIKSTQCAWNCSYKCFRGTRNCCYILLTTLFAPCLAFCSAVNFACLAFQHIWCMGPCLRTWKINFAKIKVCYQRVPDSDGGEKDIMIV